MSEIDKMSEIDELRQLVAQQMRDMQTQNAQYQKLVADLIAELARAPARDSGVVVAEAASGATAARADKISEMSLALRKGHRVKNLSEMSEMSIREYLTMFDQEVSALKVMHGVTDDLARDEIVELFKNRMDHLVDLLCGGSYGGC